LLTADIGKLREELYDANANLAKGNNNRANVDNEKQRLTMASNLPSIGSNGTTDNSAPPQDNSAVYDDNRMDDADDNSSMHSSDLHSDPSDNHSQNKVMQMLMQLRQDFDSTRKPPVTDTKTSSSSNRIDNSTDGNVMVAQSEVPYLDKMDSKSLSLYRISCRKFPGEANRSRNAPRTKHVFDRIFAGEQDVDGESFDYLRHDHVSSEDLCVRALKFLKSPNPEENMYKADLKQTASTARTLTMGNPAVYENLLADIMEDSDRLAEPLTKSEHSNMITDFRKNTSIDSMDKDHKMAFYRELDDVYARLPVKTFPAYVSLVCDERLGTMKAIIDKFRTVIFGGGN
jgi:hypothetical protein